VNRYARRSVSASTEPRPEATFQKTVLDLLAWKRYPLVFHVQNSRGSAPGFPDLIACKPGHLVALELKSARGKPTPTQLAWIAAMDGSRVDAMVAWPNDLARIEALLS
jgi:hypothetical protein